MPTISNDTQQERQLIVQAAVGCFIKNGMAETSMADVVEGSGLPAEEVHRHFPAKNDIIRALGAVNKAAAAGMLKDLLAEKRLPGADEMLGRSASFFSSGAANNGPMSVVPQAWGVALYDDEINVLMRGVLGELQDLWVELARRMAEEGRLPNGADPEDVGRTFGCIIVGYMVQSLLSDVQPEHLRRALHTLLR
jgi:AcrR family transcriptional regulator